MQKSETKVKYLTIGYGNQLRGDDGIGPKVADLVADFHWEHVRSHALHQLTPELAAELAEVDCAIFVDACITGDEIQVISLEPMSPEGCQLGHYLHPRSLLYLAQWLYGHSPQAWLISVPGVNFELGDRLSPVAQQGVAEALSQIEKLVNNNKVL